VTELAPPLFLSDPRFRVFTTLIEWIYQQDLSVVLVQNYDCVPAQILPCLAEELSLLGTPAWRLAEGDEAKQRALLASAADVNRHMGTPWAIEEALRVQGATARLVEWWQLDPPGEPYTFELFLDAGQGNNTAVRVDELIAEVKRVKNKRSHFTFNQTLSVAGEIGVVGTVRAMTYQRLALFVPAVSPDDALCPTC